MKKSSNVLLIVLAVGIIGMAVTSGIAIGTGAIASREDMQTYAINEPFNKVQLKTASQVKLEAADEANLNVYAKAWLAKPIDIDDFVDCRVENGVLIITETPPSPEFFGFFPQPYELKLTLRLPQYIYDKLTGGTK